jgi:hypothetical protein
MPKEDLSSTRSHQSLPQGGVELSLDELAKGLASGTLSRGKAIRWMGGALLGAALASIPGVAWANDCRRLGRECRRDSQCCSRNCIRRGDDKVCACPEGKSRCGDRCVNRERNENHCGECFHRCDEGQECVGGVCEGGCPPGETVCGGDCCPEGHECMQRGNGEPPFCQPICTPSCPGTCFCFSSGDGSGTVCVAGDQRLVDSCDQCPPADLQGATICIDLSASSTTEVLACAPPCPQQT